MRYSSINNSWKEEAMPQSYTYPISNQWTTEEIIDVVNFLVAVEKVYQGGNSLAAIQASYAKFKAVVPSKSEEKQIDRDFKTTSGYSTYQVVKAMKDALNKQVSAKDKIRLEV